MELHVRLVEVFHQEQHGTYQTDVASLSLMVAGVRTYQVPGFDRRHPGPFLILLPPRRTVVCDFGPDRENWAILFATSDVAPGSRDHLVALRAGASDPWTEVPLVCELSPTEVPALQQLCLELRAHFRSPLGGSRLLLHAGVLQLLGRMLANAQTPPARDPAVQLRRLLDQDLACRHGIAALSRQCGGNHDHLRERFVRAYGITPHAYRQRQRLAEALRLLSTTDEAVAAIGAQLGFPSASHFSAVFRAWCGCTPVEARQRAR